jgi:hypothetical protein
VPLDDLDIAEIVVDRHAGVVDQDIEAFDRLGRPPNLGGVGHVEDQGRHPCVDERQFASRAGVDARGAPAQGLVHQRAADAAIGPGDQDRLVLDRHGVLLSDDDLGPVAPHGGRFRPRE